MTKQLKVALFALCSLLILLGTLIFGRDNKSTSFVILSTNDMHAQIDKFPALATAIAACRDTTTVILVDAGDRWTGNAFVDLVEHYTPIYELMNHLNYDVAIYGNHEFDKGNAYVAVANRQAQFPILGANIISETTRFPQPAPHYIVEVEGKKIGFVGVVGNFAGNDQPAGKAESYVGILFGNPYRAALEHAAYIADECDMLVLVSHSGLEYDTQFAELSQSAPYHQIISAHSHDTANDVINSKLVTQTGSRLKNVGATSVTISKDGEVSLSHQNIPLSAYAPDPQVTEMVQRYYDNPELNASIGHAAATFAKSDLNNLFAETIRARTNSNIGLYHAGGVRLASIPEGEISLATVLNVEPFGSYIATAEMSVGQLRELIMTKFNDKVNIGEAHYIDIITTVPYTVETDQSGDAVDILFPTLDPKRIYRVAMGDYIFKTYAGLNYSKGEITEYLVTETLERYIRSKAAIEPSNEQLQSIVVVEPQEE